MYCDGCGEIITGSSMRSVFDEAKKRGWKRIKHGNSFLDACPNCYGAMMGNEAVKGAEVKND